MSHVLHMQEKGQQDIRALSRARPVPGIRARGAQRTGSTRRPADSRGMKIGEPPRLVRRISSLY